MSKFTPKSQARRSKTTWLRFIVTVKSKAERFCQNKNTIHSFVVDAVREKALKDKDLHVLNILNLGGSHKHTLRLLGFRA